MKLKHRSIGYVRVSTDRQETDRQITAITRHAREQNINLVQIIEEKLGISGRSSAVKKSADKALEYYGALISGDFDRIERPGYGELMSSLESQPEITHVIFYALDRLARDAIELLLLERMFARYDVHIICVSQGGVSNTTTATGWVQFSISAIMSEMECRQTSERTSATLKEKVLAWNDGSGTVHVGRPPVGWKKDSLTCEYVRDPERWPLVEEVYLLHKKGLSYKKISEHCSISTGMVKAYLNSYEWQHNTTYN